jgi:hypothetical protein
MKMFRLLTVLSFCLCSACSTTVEELRADPGEKGTFQVNLPYIVVFHNFALAARQCSGGMQSSYNYSVVKENLSGNAARIDFVNQSALGRHVMISSDIVANNDHTDITFYKKSHFAVFTNIRSWLEDWANGHSKCDGFLYGD